MKTVSTALILTGISPSYGQAKALAGESPDNHPNLQNNITVTAH